MVHAMPLLARISSATGGRGRPRRFARLPSDFRVAVLALLGAAATIGVVPFAWYRFAHGQIAAGIVDICIASALSGVVVYAWRGGSIVVASRVCVVASTFGCVGMSHLGGLAGVLWTYPLVLGNFLLVGWRLASVMSVVATLAVAILATRQGALPPGLPAVIFVVTSLLAGTFALLFAERARAQQHELQEMATCDPLTGARNRRAMAQDLQLAVEAKARHGVDFAIALIDVDHFKRINDHYGHQAGDDVLVDMVGLLRKSVRKLDQIYRMGGEEFLVLFQAAPESALPSVCESLRGKIRAHLRCRSESVTASIGGAALLLDEDFASWIARADAALYRAKRSGRDRVELARAGDGLASARGVEPGTATLMAPPCNGR